MGQVACCDTNRLSTSNDVAGVKIYTDGEMTEFVANLHYLFPEYDSDKKEATIKKSGKLQINGLRSLETDCTPNMKEPGSYSPFEQKLSKDLSNQKSTRIFSSNVSEKSVNLIEKICKGNSICSTNVNSKNNSRCDSPIIRARSSLME